MTDIGSPADHSVEGRQAHTEHQLDERRFCGTSDWPDRLIPPNQVWPTTRACHPGGTDAACGLIHGYRLVAW